MNLSISDVCLDKFANEDVCSEIMAIDFFLIFRLGTGFRVRNSPSLHRATSVPKGRNERTETEGTEGRTVRTERKNVTQNDGKRVVSFLLKTPVDTGDQRKSLIASRCA